MSWSEVNKNRWERIRDLMDSTERSRARGMGYLTEGMDSIVEQVGKKRQRAHEAGMPEVTEAARRKTTTQEWEPGEVTEDGQIIGGGAAWRQAKMQELYGTGEREEGQKFAAGESKLQREHAMDLERLRHQNAMALEQTREAAAKHKDFNAWRIWNEEILPSLVNLEDWFDPMTGKISLDHIKKWMETRGLSEQWDGTVDGAHRIAMRYAEDYFETALASYDKDHHAALRAMFKIYVKAMKVPSAATPPPAAGVTPRPRLFPTPADRQRSEQRGLEESLGVQPQEFPGEPVTVPIAPTAREEITSVPYTLQGEKQLIQRLRELMQAATDRATREGLRMNIAELEQPGMVDQNRWRQILQDVQGLADKARRVR